MTGVEVLTLGHNNIQDISPLLELPNLRQLWLRNVPLSDVSINEYLPALQDKDIFVSFERAPYVKPLDDKGDFDIELVVIGQFNAMQRREIDAAVQRWTSIIKNDLPDYHHDRTYPYTRICGDQEFSVQPGDQIDDLRIYIGSINDREVTPLGWASPYFERAGTFMPIIGCVVLNTAYGVDRGVVLHEIAHVLGMNPLMWRDKGFLQGVDVDVHFNGPLAVAAFNNAGGHLYEGTKVPLEKFWNSGHWRTGILSGEIMSPFADGGVLSAITIQALADMGYQVDVSKADPFKIDPRMIDAIQAATKPITPMPICGSGQWQGPVYVVDEQGHVVDVKDKNNP